MSDLNDLVEPLKRELAVPGEYDTIFPNTSDDDLLNSLADGFSEAQLDGYFSDYTLDLETFETDPDVSAGGGALIVIYAGMRIIRAQMRALTLTEKYQAGNVSYEVGRSANLLREELRYLEQRKADLVRQASNAGADTTQYDNYFTRSAVNWASVGGLYPAELGW